MKEQASINNDKNWFIGNEKSLMDLSYVKKDFVFRKRKFCFADEWTLTILYNTEANTDVAKSSKIHFANSVKHCGHNWEEKNLKEFSKRELTKASGILLPQKLSLNQPRSESNFHLQQLLRPQLRLQLNTDSVGRPWAGMRAGQHHYWPCCHCPWWAFRGRLRLLRPDPYLDYSKPASCWSPCEAVEAGACLWPQAEVVAERTAASVVSLHRVTQLKPDRLSYLPLNLVCKIWPRIWKLKYGGEWLTKQRINEGMDIPWPVKVRPTQWISTVVAFERVWVGWPVVTLIRGFRWEASGRRVLRLHLRVWAFVPSRGCVGGIGVGCAWGRHRTIEATHIVAVLKCVHCCGAHLKIRIVHLEYNGP